MAKWYRVHIYGVQAHRDTNVTWDGGTFTVRAGEWLVTGDHILLSCFTDAEWQALEGCQAQETDADDSHEAQVLAELERALQTGLY